MTTRIQTKKEIEDYLSYDPYSGVFTWIKRPSYSVRAGAIAGVDDGRGYLVLGFRDYRYYCHRLAFIMMGQSLSPNELVDHINQNKSDNSWGNLRKASHSENSQNRITPNTNNSGAKGVCWDKNKNKWRVYCQHKHFGYFLDLQEAKEVYEKISKETYREFYNEN